MVSKPDPSRHAPEEIDAYLDGVGEDSRVALQRLRETIRKAAPESTERVSYGIPIFRLRSDLVGISFQKKHCSLHIMSPDLTERMAEELKGFRVSGATVHFSPGQPLPGDLVEKIVRERTKEISSSD